MEFCGEFDELGKVAKAKAPSAIIYVHSSNYCIFDFNLVVHLSASSVFEWSMSL